MRSKHIQLQPDVVLVRRYLLKRLLGTGAMAEVWEAQDLEYKIPVAIKILSELLAPSQQAHRRFEREAQAIGSIHHPNVASLLGHGEIEDSRPFLIMELLQGKNLADYLKDFHTINFTSTLILGTQILKGLSAAHEKGIIHRDLKPANIFIAQQKSDKMLTKILDFGVAFIRDLTAQDEGRLTRTGTLLGSPQYMSLEIARGDRNCDARSDIFGVGAILYHCLTGTPPFSGKSIGEIMSKIAKHQVVSLAQKRPDLPHDLIECVERAMSPKVDDRYDTAKEMYQSLFNVLSQFSITN